jgi:hypothetical protein
MNDQDRARLNELAKKMFVTREAAGKATMEFYYAAYRMEADELAVFYAWFEAGFKESQSRNMLSAFRNYSANPPVESDFR